MANSVRVPITNVFMGGDYTGRILVGPEKVPMNVVLDTGSSALAVDGKKYKPDLTGGDKPTSQAQTDSYGDGSSWTGAVIHTTISMGEEGSAAVLPVGNLSVAYSASADTQPWTMLSRCRRIPGRINTHRRRYAPANRAIWCRT